MSAREYWPRWEDIEKLLNYDIRENAAYSDLIFITQYPNRLKYCAYCGGIRTFRRKSPTVGGNWAIYRCTHNNHVNRKNTYRPGKGINTDVYVRNGTIFAHSIIPMYVWFSIAMYLHNQRLLGNYHPTLEDIQNSYKWEHKNSTPHKNLVFKMCWLISQALDQLDD